MFQSRLSKFEPGRADTPAEGLDWGPSAGTLHREGCPTAAAEGEGGCRTPKVDVLPDRQERAAAPRRDGPAQRPADPRADPLGRRGSRRRRGDQVASERKPELAPKLAARVPGVRGPLKLAEAMAVLPLVRRRLPAARLPFEDWRVIAAVGDDLAATAALRKRMGSSALREAFVQAIGAVPAAVALMDRDLAAYHGVEHKAIAAYEQGVEDPATVPKEHDRCGSNLIAPMMLLSAGGTVLLERLVERPARWRGPGSGSAASPSRSRCSPGATATTTPCWPRLPRAGPGDPAAAGDQGADPRAARGRRCRARRDPPRRAGTGWPPPAS